MKKWVINRQDTKAVSLITSKTDIKKLAAQVLVSRGIDTIEKISEFFSVDELSSPFLIKDMKEAVQAINSSVEKGESICIYGDYDCDGITSTVMLYSYLYYLGADVSYYIPERSEGYGLNKDAVKAMHQNGVNLVITVDNGISAFDEAELIYELGMKLVITDHHQPSQTLPRAEAIIDPHRNDCPSVFKNLCGAGVVLKLLAAMDDGEYDAVSEQFGDLAAIATIADIVSLNGENRTIVKNGLQYLANTENMGLSNLIEESRISTDKINSTAVAFMLAPRINASGRFGSPKTAVKLLLSEDEDEAAELSKEISSLNSQRKAVEKDIVIEIERYIEENPYVLNQRVLVFSGKGWHHGVIGIVCSRIVQKYGKPVFIISEENNEARGSARGIAGYSIFNALTACKDLLVKYGGHSGAGGFSLEPDRIDDFRQMLYDYSKETYPQMPVVTINVDKVIEPDELNTAVISGLGVLEPFGEGNPLPLFAILSARVEDIIPLSGGTHTKLKLNYHNTYIYALLFNVSPDKFTLKAGDTGDFLAYIDVSAFGGRESISIKIHDYRKSGISQSKYFSAKEIYEKYMRGEDIPQNLISKIVPKREDLVSVYKAISSDGTTFDTLFCNINSDTMNYCKLRFCIDIFRELNLVTVDYITELVTKNNVKTKTDIESSEFLRKLRCL